MLTKEALIAERDATLLRARELTAFIASDSFYAPDITESERFYVKKQEAALLEYHANLIHQLAIKESPITGA